jgi:hypothetical protein
VFRRRKNRFDSRKTKFEKTHRTTAEKKSLKINTGFIAEKNVKIAEIFFGTNFIKA